jgi:preprotein translocase subunit YajC
MDLLFNLLIPVAYADTPANAAPQGGGFSFIIIMVAFFLFIYFAIWRPQSKRAKEQQSLLSSLTKGDEVITSGGILGKITKITDQYLTLNVSNNVDITLQKSSVLTVLPKGTLKSIE